MKFLHTFIIIVCCLLWHGASAYYTAEQLEQIEQKYESPMESEDQDYFANTEQQQQQQPSAIETLNQAFSHLEPAQVKNYGQSSGGIPASLLSGSSYGSSSNFNSGSDLSGLKSLEGKSSEYSKVTHIPSGSLFSMPAKGPNPMEFESPYSKQPYSIVFRTHSMPVKIKQQHQTLPAPEVEFVRSQEEAHVIKNHVYRPVIQEVHEIIQPFRKVTQEVRPVQEEIHTIVSKGESRGGNGGNGSGSRGGSGNGSSAKGGAGPALSAGRSSDSNGSFGRGSYRGQSAGGLSIGYSEHQPSYVSPVTQYRTQASPVHQQPYAMPHYAALRVPFPHARY